MRFSGAPGRCSQGARERSVGGASHGASLLFWAMFDAADFVALPEVAQPISHGVHARKNGAGSHEGFRAKRSNTTAAAATAATVLNRNTYHVVQACAMAGDDVALAMSNGDLCHAKLSRSRTVAAEPVPVEERGWPTWSSWPSRSGKVQSLQYDRAHDALVTLEVSILACPLDLPLLPCDFTPRRKQNS